jgi:hypothetical protein
MATSRGRFYRVLDAVEHPGRWHLRAPVTAAGEAVDPWQFTQARPLHDLPPLRVSVRYPGVPLSFTFAGFDIPVVSQEVQAALAGVGALQWVGVEVGDAPGASDEYLILNVLQKARCLDETRSQFTRWMPHDGRPDRMGSYRMVTQLAIDPERAPGDVFRVDGWEVALIVSDAVRSALEPFSGIRFERVS